MPMQHHTRRYAAIRQLVLAMLGEGQRIEGRRRMARFLRSLAEELERPRTGGPAPGGPPGEGLHWNGADLVIGLSLWRGIGEARRVSFEFAGTETRIRPDPDGNFTIRRTPTGAARSACVRAWHIGQWAEGWRPGRVERGAIVFEGEATRQRPSATE